MSFSSKHEESQYKRWLKTSPFGQTAKEIFGDIFPNQETCLNLFRQDKENIKKKIFIPFEDFYRESFIEKLPTQLSEAQDNLLNALAWEFILQKIDSMNKVLEKAYDLLDKQDLIKGLELTKYLADAGHPEACYLLASFSLQGPIKDRRYDFALKYAQRAMKYVAHPRACLVLAGIYFQGFGVEVDHRKAVSFVLQAERIAESDPTVYPILAEYYQDGYIVHRDVDKVAHFSHKAEQMGEFR